MTRRAGPRVVLALAIALGGCGDDGDATPPASEVAAPDEPAPVPPPEEPPEGWVRFEERGLSFLHPAGSEVAVESAGGVVSAAVEGEDGSRFIVLSSPDVVSPEEAMAVQRSNVATAAVQSGARIVEDDQAPSRDVAGRRREGRRFVFETPRGPELADLYSFGLADRTVTVVLSYPDAVVGHEEALDRMASSLRVAPGED